MRMRPCRKYAAATLEKACLSCGMGIHRRRSNTVSVTNETFARPDTAAYCETAE